ncbi:hypothetical protein YC2023_100283 [Brassica napus]
MVEDWDLRAVVRGCSAVSSSATTTTTVFSTKISSRTNHVFTFEPRNNTVLFGEIRDLYTPFTQHLCYLGVGECREIFMFKLRLLSLERETTSIEA